MFRLLALPLIALTLTSLAAEPAHVLRLSCAIKPGHPVHTILIDLYSQALAPLGYQVLLVYRPSRRGLVDAAAGQLDGDCARTPQVEDHQNYAMIRVPQPLWHITLYAWSYNPALQDLPADALLNGPYKLAYVRGNLTAEKLLKGRPTGSSLDVLTPEQGLKMLSARRIDALLGVRVLVESAQRELQPDRRLFASAPLAQFSAYLYLHPRHRDLAGPMAEQLARLLSDPAHPAHQLAIE